MDFSKLNVSNGSGEPVRALVTALRNPGSTVINVNSIVNWPADFVATTGPLLADGSFDPDKTIVFLGHLSGSTIIIDQLAPGYTDANGNSVNDVVVIKPNTWWADTVADAAGAMGTFIEENGDWRAFTGLSITGVTNNGNRSYDLTTNVDTRTKVSPGMRLRTTRTVAAPTQSTSLNGTNQYWNDTSVSGMTFTDDFTVGAWIKLDQYTVGSTVISRFNGTNGWDFLITDSGAVRLRGYNGAATNWRDVISYQSIPLNKWVHVTAQLDMSAHSVSSTTSYVMIDGVNVPAQVTQNGTNPTALVQAGSIEVGSRNGGTIVYSGKIAQPFVSSAKITQANIRTLMTQGITPSLITSNNIISAYAFDGNANDLNTTNANNLTAQNGATATNAESPFGGQGDGTISSTLDYGIVQKVTASTITIQVAEGCTIPTSGGVASVSYSTQRSPYNFPSQRVKWEIITFLRSDLVQASAVNGTWYNIGSTSMDVPLGEWNLGYSVNASASNSTSSPDIATTLSTTNNGETDFEFRVRSLTTISNATQYTNPTRSRNVSLTAMTKYYLNAKSDQNGGPTIAFLAAAAGAGWIKAENAYL